MGFDIAKHTTDFGLNENRDWLASAHGTEGTRTGTLDVSTLVADTHFPTGGGLVKSGTAVALHSGSGLWQPYSALDAVDEVQTLTRTSTGGTVDLTFDGETATGVSASAAGFTAAAVTTALEGLASVNPGDIVVTGSAGGPLTVTYAGDRAGENVPAISVDNTNATGGTIVAATSTAGAAGTWAALGLLFDSTVVTGTSDSDKAVAILEHGFVVESKLPSGHGVTAAFKSAAPLIHFR